MAEHIFALSIGRQVPLSVRQRFAFSTEEASQFYARLRQHTVCAGAVLVSTCNRTELYVSAPHAAVADMELELASAKGADIHLLRQHVSVYAGGSAVRHLFQVAAGLDSLILGENEILGQLRAAYKQSVSHGASDFYMHTMFQAALRCAKRIKTETCLAKSSTSVATLCVRRCMNFARLHAEAEPSVLLLGASGTVGRRILMDLAEREGVTVYACMRHAQVQQAQRVQVIPYKARYDVLDRCAVIVSVTRSPHYTLTFERCRQAMRTQRPRLFIDLAVPLDIDPDVRSLPFAQLEIIDDFKTIAQKNQRLKDDGVGQAERIINDSALDLQKDMLFHEQKDFIEEFVRSLEGRSAAQLFFRLRDAATPAQWSQLVALCRSAFFSKKN